VIGAEMCAVSCLINMKYLNVFFFKQKTAYEIGTGDWSSDGALPISNTIIINGGPRTLGPKYSYLMPFALYCSFLENGCHLSEFAVQYHRCT